MGSDNGVKTKDHYEFGGPIGAAGITLSLPVMVFALMWLCPSGEPCVAVTEAPGTLSKGVASLFDGSSKAFKGLPEALAVIICWIGFQAILERVLPAEVVEGVTLKEGGKLTYRINGHLAFWISLLVMGHGKPKFGADGSFQGLEAFDLTWLYFHYDQLALASMIVATVLAIYVYAGSFKAGAKLAAGGNSGNWIYDFYIGRELNPRVRGTNFDIKVFCELRPGLIGWVVINIGCLMAQETVTPAMIAINIFQGLYVWDALYQERAILTTMDVTTDGFGYMLAFGDLCWVPFTYTLQARYLVGNPGLSGEWTCAVVVLNAIGYAIFRGANGEKDAFRRDPSSPNLAHLKFLKTKRGTKLLISGWWGMARKINYTGDWLMGTAWCLTTGFDSPFTFFYSGYFAVLLIHRAWRDDEFCHEKYGDDWVRYKKAVPAVFFPYLF